MTDDPTTIDLAMPELREVAAFAARCARDALAVAEWERPGDPRPRAAVDAAQAFADGAERTKALRDAAWAAQKAANEARDAGHPAVAEAARAALAAAGAAYLHPLAKATQVTHILGSAAHTARAFELAAGDDDRIGYAHVVRAWAFASPTVIDVLDRYPTAPGGGGRVGELTRQLDTLLRRPDAPTSPRLLDVESVTWALQALVGVRAWSSWVGIGTPLAIELGGRLISSAGGVRGEFSLWVYGGAWMIRRDDRVVATSDDERPVMESAAQGLCGMQITAIALSIDGLALRVELDGSTVLTVVPWPELDLTMERWQLFLPDGFVVCSGPGPLLRLERADEVDPSAPSVESPAPSSGSQEP